MPLQNRVTPFSKLIATAARGTLMGNRGCLHDENKVIRRDYTGKRWILCLLNFNNRRRNLMTPHEYTELFFLDEATGFAAGHRPCAECQRERYNLFCKYWLQGNPAHIDAGRLLASQLDAILHQERLDCTSKNIRTARLSDLAPGVMVSLDDSEHAYLVQRHRLLYWQAVGYDDVVNPSQETLVHVLTPKSIVNTIRAGFPVALHPSALER